MSQGQPPPVMPPATTSVTEVRGTGVAAVPGQRHFAVGRYLNVLLFAGPSLLLITVLVFYPLVKTVIFTFQHQSGIGYNAPLQWVGWDNYVNMWQDSQIHTAVINNFLWLVIVTPVTVVLGVLFAVLFDKVRYEPVAKSIVFIPMAISGTAAGVIWKLMYADDPNIGTINALITHIPGVQAVSFLGTSSFVNFALMGAQVWTGLGFAVIVLSAALKSIPQELTEAAKIDGATAVQIFRKITVPLMWPTITVIITLTMIGVLKIFDIIYTMTGGGPAGASQVLATRMYTEAFTNVDAGYGSAIAVVLLVAVIPIMAINIKRFKSETAR